MKKHLLPLTFLALVAAILAGTFLHAPPVFDQQMLANLGHPTRMVENLEQYFHDNLWMRQPLRTLYISLRTAAGNREKNGLFLCDNGLVANFIPSEDTGVHKKNTAALMDFPYRTDLPTALLLLPTASAIYRDRLPPFAGETQYNQHAFIQGVGEQLLGSVAVIDAYPTLYSARKEPLYYRTDSDLTSRGGYLAYTMLVRRLGLAPMPESSFHQQFSSLPYYGKLYQQWGYPGVRADTVSAYRLTENPPLVTVEHWLRFQQKTYHTLYPTQAAVSGNPRDMILGGHSPKIEITNRSVSGSSGNLLVLGDSNAMGILPFLALHYGHITFADPSLLTDSEMTAITAEGYSQAIFVFSLETYMNSAQPSRAALVGLEL